MGAATSEQHLAMLVDGYVCGIVGMHLSDLFRGREKIDGHLYVEETYGFNVASYRYPRLNRLLMMLITTRQFLSPLAANIYEPYGLATTCLTQYPDLKINRGILKLVSREKLKNGMFKLRYATPAKDKTYQEVVQEWLQKHSQPSARLIQDSALSPSATG